MTLNAGQGVAVDGVLRAFLQENEPGRIIVGEGGTGKTYCTAYLIEQFIEAGLTVIMTAPTNKAVKQLEKAAREAGLDMNRITFKTLHSGLGLSLLPDEDRKFASRVRAGILELYDVVVIDEASMLSKVLLMNYLLPDQRKANYRILMLGDAMQLPPPKETHSLAFDLFPTYELTQNQRQTLNEDGTPNGILELTAPLRTAIREDKRFNFSSIPDNNVVALKDAQFKKYILEQFDKDSDLDNLRVMAWRNYRVDEINRMIREKIYGADALPFEEGERVVTGEPIKNDEGEMILGTDEECIVAAVSDSYVVDEVTGDEYKTRLLALRPIHANVDQVFAHVLHEDAKALYDARIKKLADRASTAVGSAKGLAWRRWHEFKELFSNIRYCYCITVHRSQGSTYDHGIVDVKDIMDNPRPKERRQLLYVGFSRCRKLLSINKTGFIT